MVVVHTPMRGVSCSEVGSENLLAFSVFGEDRTPASGSQWIRDLLDPTTPGATPPRRWTSATRTRSPRSAPTSGLPASVASRHESQTAVELVVAASERWQSAGRSEQQANHGGPAPYRSLSGLLRRANPSAILAAMETADRDLAAMVSGTAAYRLRLLSHYPQQ